MTIAAALVDIAPVRSITNEIARIVFHLSGVPEPFVAYGRAATTVAGLAIGNRVSVEASSMVELIAQGSAILVDIAVSIPGVRH